MDAPWLFGRADDSPPPSPDLEPAQGDELIPEQIPSILGQRAVITYFCDGARAPVTTVERQDAPLPPARPDAYAICLTLDMTSGCGGTIWPAAEVLGAYIASMMTRTHTTPDTHPWRGKTIVELGSGTGLIGFLVAQIGCGATTWITDQVPMLPLMDSNTQLNKERMVDACHVAELNWYVLLLAHAQGRADPARRARQAGRAPAGRLRLPRRGIPTVGRYHGRARDAADRDSLQLPQKTQGTSPD